MANPSQDELYFAAVAADKAGDFEAAKELVAWHNELYQPSSIDADQKTVSIQDDKPIGIKDVADQRKPDYDTAAQASLKAAQNVPEEWMQQYSGIARMLGGQLEADEEANIQRSIGLIKKFKGVDVSPLEYKALYLGMKEGVIDKSLSFSDAIPIAKQIVEASKAEGSTNIEETFSESTPAGKVLGHAERVYQSAEEDKKQINVEPQSLAYYAAGTVSGATNLIPMLGLSAALGPAAGVALLSGQVAGGAYNQAKQEGASHDEAQLFALGSIVTEAIPEALVVGKILKAKNLFGKLGIGAAGNALQETITEALNIGLEKGVLDQDTTWEEAKVRLVDAGILGTTVGAGMGGALSAGQAGVEAVQNKITDRRVDKAFEQIGTPQEVIDQEAVRALSPENAGMLLEIKNKLPQEKSMAELVLEKRFELGKLSSAEGVDGRIPEKGLQPVESFKPASIFSEAAKEELAIDQQGFGEEALQQQEPISDIESTIQPSIPESLDEQATKDATARQGQQEAEDKLLEAKTTRKVETDLVIDPDKRRGIIFSGDVTDLKEELGLNDNQIKVITERLDRPVAKDTVTGFYTAPDRIPAIQRVINNQKSTPVNATYVEADIANLAGMNEFLGHSGANKVFNKITSILNDEFVSTFPDADIVAIRHGGDEISFVISGIAENEVNKASDIARKKVRDYIKSVGRGLESLPHTKPKGKPGVGISIGASPIMPGKEISETLSQADRLVEIGKKEGVTNERRTETKTDSAVPQKEGARHRREDKGLRRGEKAGRSNVGGKGKKTPRAKQVKESADKVKKQTKLKLEASNIFNMAGSNYRRMFKSGGFPERPESGFVMLNDKKIKLKSEDKPTRREGIQAQVEGIIGPRLYTGKIIGKAEGFYNTKSGEIRSKNMYDVEVLAHEMAHYLDMYSGLKGKFTKLYSDPELRSEIEKLSYTNKADVVAAEGFAEYMRLWLTQYNEAASLAPKFTRAFNKEISSNFKLNRQMHRLQADMHRWVNQGDLARLNAVTSDNQYTATQSASRKLQQYPAALWRQHYIDNIHAAKVITRETSGKIGDATEDAYKQLQLLNGIHGIFEQSTIHGAPYLAENGDIKFKGPSINDIWGVSVKHSAKRLREQEMYFAARRAMVLSKQGRENLITPFMIKEGLKLGEIHTYFKKAYFDHIKYKKNMMEFYVETGYVTPDAAAAMLKSNPGHVPFNRASDDTSGGGAGGGFQRLKGGTGNIKHIYNNIVMQESKHLQSALKAKALRDLYEQALKSEDSSKFFSEITADMLPNLVPVDQMVKKAKTMMDELGVELTDKDGNTVKEENIEDYFKDNQEELMFWTFGQMPKTAETMVTSYIDRDGKRVWLEINKENKLLPDMLDSLDGLAMPDGVLMLGLEAAMKVKQLQTLFITTMPQFMIPNIVRDQQQAFFLSGGTYKPFLDTSIGLGHYLHSFVSKGGLVAQMQAQGGPGGGRIKTFMENDFGFAQQKNYRPDKPFYHPTQLAKTLLDIYVNIMDSAEMATRIGFYARMKKEGKTSRESAFEAREISTDFHKHGSYPAFVLLQRTVPFFGAAVQSFDRDLRGMMDNNGEIKLTNLIKTESGRATLKDLQVRMAMIGSLYVSIHLTLALLGSDEERYRELTPDQKARFFHYFINGEHHTIPKPHGLITLLGSFAESMVDVFNDQTNKEAARDIQFALAFHLGIGGMPGIVNPFYDLAINETFTGAPVVGRAAQGRSAERQYSYRTPQLYVKAGEALGISPEKTRHLVKGYAGYVEEIIAEASEAALWNYESWGERPNKRTATEMLTKQFKPREVPFRTKYTVGYYEIKKQAAMVEADFSFAKKVLGSQPAAAGKVLSDKVNKTLFGLNSLFSEIDKILSHQTEILSSIYYNPKFSADEKTVKIEDWYKTKNALIKQAYSEAEKLVGEAEKYTKKIKELAEK